MRRLVRFGVGAALVGVACHHGAPETAVAPEPDSPAPVAISIALTPSAASGSYRLRATIQSNRRTTQSGQGGIIQLSATPAPPPVQHPAGTQFNAVVAPAGYTRAPRGRSGQSAAWWPIGGDSVVVQFTASNSGEIQLRGSWRGRAIQGEVWFLSTSGATFQMGTFTATKGR
jgi:hypothetical protein